MHPTLLAAVQALSHVTWWQIALAIVVLILSTVFLLLALSKAGIVAPIILNFSVLHIRLEELRQAHGNFFKMWAGWKRFYIINDPAGKSSEHIFSFPY